MTIDRIGAAALAAAAVAFLSSGVWAQDGAAPPANGAPANGASANGARGARPAQNQAPIPPKDPLYIPTPARDFNGVWWAASYSPMIKPMATGPLPFTAEGMAAYQKNLAGLKDKTVVDEARHICVPDGVPRILTTPYPFEIFLTPDQVTFAYEVNHVFRQAYMDASLPSPELLQALEFYSGHAIGHWEGDTLVIQSAGFKDTTFLDDSGAPHSDQMTTVERIRKIDGGRELEDVVTVTDPVTFTKPWEARFVYEKRPEVQIEDFVCGEKHRDLKSVKGAPHA